MRSRSILQKQLYEAHVCSEEGWNALGGLLAGGTSILHGVNENLGWAHTVNYSDRVDVFQLEINPANPMQYKFDGEWVNLEKRIVRLHIKGVPVAIRREALWSKYGATMKNKQGVFSIRTGANMEIRALDQWYQMNKAKSFSEFYQIISTQGLSMFNITYADNRDTIFYVNNGFIPVRDSNRIYEWKKTVPGNTSKTLWTKFRTYNELPQYINPRSGYLFNTNHSPFFATGMNDNLDPSKFPVTDGWETWHNNRSARLTELIPADRKISYDELKKMKFDRQLPKELHYPYSIDSLFSLSPLSYPEYADIINTFRNWDRRGDTDSKGAAIFLLAYLYLARQLQGQDPRAITQAEALDTYRHIKEYMMKNFGRTGINLGELQRLVRGTKDYPLAGFPDLLSPQWTVPFKNGQLRASGGDAYIVFVRFPRNELPLIESVNMYGASSHQGSKHYDDQVPLYLQQKTKTMTLNKAEVYRLAERVYHPQ
jgi:acyl-homoserine-lactone acylase